MEEYDVYVVSVIVQEFLEERVVKVHLYKYGFRSSYWILTDRGEDMVQGDLYNNDNYMALGMDVAHNQPQDDQFMWMEDMMYDALRQQESFQEPNVDNKEEPPNEETQIL